MYGLDKDKRLIEFKKLYSSFLRERNRTFINKHVNKNLKIGSDEKLTNSDIYIITVGTPINKVTKARS